MIGTAELRHSGCWKWHPCEITFYICILIKVLPFTTSLHTINPWLSSFFKYLFENYRQRNKDSGTEYITERKHSKVLVGSRRFLQLLWVGLGPKQRNSNSPQIFHMNSRNQALEPSPASQGLEQQETTLGNGIQVLQHETKVYYLLS